MIQLQKLVLLLGRPFAATHVARIPTRWVSMRSLENDRSIVHHHHHIIIYLQLHCHLQLLLYQIATIISAAKASNQFDEHEQILISINKLYKRRRVRGLPLIGIFGSQFFLPSHFGIFVGYYGNLLEYLS